MTLMGHKEPRPTYLGVAILIAAAAIMLWLASEKRKLLATAGSPALRADATQSALCGYLSPVALAGLAANAIWHVAWADPIAAIVVKPLVLWEGNEAIRGKACRCSSLDRSKVSCEDIQRLRSPLGRKRWQQPNWWP